MAGKKPIIDPPSHHSRFPITTAPGKPRCWAFSFRYWRQIEFFGLDQVDLKWMVSALEVFAELCRKQVDAFVADFSMKEAFRYHAIDWTLKNVPIQRKDLNWIDRVYLENETEYPLMQFQISKALGRIVGFWDEHTIFNIVLLDPLHNIQPAKDFAYKVDRCSPFPSDYDCLLKHLDDLKTNQQCLNPEQCLLPAAVRELPRTDYFHTTVLFRLDHEKYEEAKKLVAEGLASSLTEIFEFGIIAAFVNKPMDSPQAGMAE